MRRHVERHLRLKWYLELELSNSTSLLQTLGSCYNVISASRGHDAPGFSDHMASDSKDWVGFAARHRSLLLRGGNGPPDPESHLLS